MKKLILTSATILFIGISAFAADGDKCAKKCEKKCEKACKKDETCKKACADASMKCTKKDMKACAGKEKAATPAVAPATTPTN